LQNLEQNRREQEKLHKQVVECQKRKRKHNEEDRELAEEQQSPNDDQCCEEHLKNYYTMTQCWKLSTVFKA
jgi:hypothetical protein